MSKKVGKHKFHSVEKLNLVLIRASRRFSVVVMQTHAGATTYEQRLHCENLPKRLPWAGGQIALDLGSGRKEGD